MWFGENKDIFVLIFTIKREEHQDDTSFLSCSHLEFDIDPLSK
jgi:hypothetical protein